MKKYHSMNTHNTNTKMEEREYNLRTNEIAPLRTTGSQALSELSGKLASADMPHLDIPEIKKTYQEKVKQMEAQGQVVNSQFHKGLYDLAVGENITKVQDKIQQGFLREQETIVNVPTGASGRENASDSTTVPTVEKFFDQEALQKLSQKHHGLTPLQAADREFARHGGYTEWYKKFYAEKEGEK